MEIRSWPSPWTTSMHSCGCTKCGRFTGGAWMGRRTAASLSVGRGPGADLAEGHRDGIADVDGEAEHPLGAVVVLRVEELELHVPAVAVDAAHRAPLHLDGGELHALAHGLG